MQVSSLQKIDRWLGVPLCFLLTIVRKIFGGELKGRQPVRNILLVKLAEQGSTVLAYSAIRRAVDMVGSENVYFIVFDENRFILDALGLVPEKNVITISFKTFPDMVSTAFGAIRRMRGLKFDAAVDMEFFARGSAAITFLSGARSRLGFHSYFGAGPYRGDLMTHRLLYNPYLHTSQTFQVMIEGLKHDPAMFPMFGIAPPKLDEELPRFPARADEVEAVKAMLQRELARLELPPVILLNPNASDLLPLRRWEP